MLSCDVYKEISRSQIKAEELEGLGGEAGAPASPNPSREPDPADGDGHATETEASKGGA